jgi:tetratricopeptide (TPR) repeat protein
MKLGSLVIILSVMTSPAANAGNGDSVAVGAELYLQQADQALREGRLVQAEHMIEWLDQNAGSVSKDDLALVKAEYAIARNDVSGAASSVDMITDASRNICRQYSARGWVAANKNQLDKAISALARAAENCPEDAGIWNLLGLTFIGKGETAAAKEAFEQAILRAPDSPELINNYALTMVQQGELTLAMQQLAGAAKIAPHNHLILANRDFVSGMMGRAPVREQHDSDASWSERLINTGKGAKAAARAPEAKALFSRALLLLDHFDDSVWSAMDSKTESQPQ